MQVFSCPIWGPFQRLGQWTRTWGKGRLPAEVRRGLLTKFFKEGLHKAGPGMEVRCVHIQVGDFFGCEEGGEQAISEEGGGPGPLLVLRTAGLPCPLGLLSHTGHSTQVAKHVHILNHFPAFKLCFPFYIVIEDLLLQVKGCPEPSIENRIEGLLWGQPGDSWQTAAPFILQQSCEGGR